MRKLVVLTLCVFGLLCTTAQAGAPRWYGKETGALVPWGGGSGLTEITSEPLAGIGQIGIVTTHQSYCLTKTHLAIGNPSNPELSGTSSIGEFDIICEEGTGPGPNDAKPLPCTNGEAFELRAINPPLVGTLETGEYKTNPPKKPIGAIRNLPRYYDNFSASFALWCLKSKRSNIYSGMLHAEVEVGRLTFRKEESGALEDASGNNFTIAGSDWIVSAAYKNVRVNSVYSEQQLVQHN